MATTIHTAISARWAVKGTTGDVTECGCCGRTDLRKTVALAELDADGNPGDVVFMGTTCAARATGRPAAKVTKAAAAADKRRADLAEHADLLVANIAYWAAAGNLAEVASRQIRLLDVRNEMAF